MKNISIIFDKTRLFWEKSFLDIIFPKRCIDCGREGNFVCYDCAEKIEIIKTMTCAVCGKISKSGQFCPGCKIKWGLELSGLIVAADYDSGPTKEMIHHLKYSGFTELADPLSEMIYQVLKNNMPRGNFVAVPVPLHRNREALRGFNQSELIIRGLCQKLGLHGGCAINRVKDTETQVSLDKIHRKQNLGGAFNCTDKGLIYGKNVLLVDDVATTLTTLNECAKVLKSAGAKKIWGVVVARRI